ncbi:F0F1 ATP synthase subunit B [Hydrogenimonas thermophila]|uniref:ATP synthase subunit b n=1 Tax=Hydrogenimonas thermophila TaxID=223786 RepID=A0A1I5SI78_9BACT|nr:F0F1 ATP synthase subunit B [Hydrogenimonas thermophila]WOE70871.1 F0F1 ATP synthase subunit B [Hydrogenimonas thermophila]WOE73389.1 F0F1 ATP synthase subunit B [Hydrogenimonas thermophila]SFP70419.1 F-type H+-transporting ATPase subunit b [Hydrogenimonas thermophila]
MRKTLIVAALFLPAVAFASGHEAAGGETDFIPRLVNFLIFAAILYYFVADLIKNFFTGRSKEISSKLEEVQNRLKATKRAKEDAEAAYKAALATAEEIIESAKKESQLLAKKMDEQLNTELENLEKMQEEKMAVEKRQMVRKTVAEVLSELYKGDAISMDEKKFVNLITKKVA